LSVVIVAITRPTGAELRDCELTHVDRIPIDVARACVQHNNYLEVLRSLGVKVVGLPRLPGHPDAVFVEDTALVLPEVAVLLRPGAESRRGEVPSMAATLADYRECREMEAPATLDGGDVLVFGREVLVGQTTRSNPAGIAALTDLLSPFDYTVETVPVRGVLHLKSAATVVDDETLIVFSPYVDLTGLGAGLLEAHPDEPQGANVVRVGDTLLVDASAPQTVAMLAAHVDNIVEIHVDEFAKAEGAISCKGIIFEA
jgi:dimethylargininase